jgi:hypothetical protein
MLLTGHSVKMNSMKIFSLIQNILVFICICSSIINILGSTKKISWMEETFLYDISISYVMLTAGLFMLVTSVINVRNLFYALLSSPSAIIILHCMFITGILIKLDLDTIPSGFDKVFAIVHAVYVILCILAFAIYLWYNIVKWLFTY